MTHNKPIIFAAAAVLSASTVFAQQLVPAGKGLDSIDEHGVYTLLVNSKVESLLDYDMAKNGVSATEKEQIKAVASLDMLVNNAAMSSAARRALAKQAAIGLMAQLPKNNNPDSLLLSANELTLGGINQQVTEIEYFGEAPAVQADLKPVVDTARQYYAKYLTLLTAQTNALSSQLNGPNGNAVLQKLNALDAKSLAADYFNSRLGYAQCISTPAKDPARLKIANETITALSAYDNADQGLQPEMKVMLGKLCILKGDYEGAQKYFDTIISHPADLKPAPTVYQQNDARYFMVVAELKANNVSKATSDVDSLDSWQKANLQLSPADQANVSASLEMLKFRILSQRSDIANSKSSKEELNNQAIETLTNLLKSQPNNRGLKDLIYDQIRGRIKPGTSLDKMDTLALLAIRQQGFDSYDEVLKNPKKAVDEKVVAAAIDAARELIHRKGQPGVDSSVVVESQRFIPLALDKVLHKPAEAGPAYVDFAASDHSNMDLANFMLNEATVILKDLHDAKDADSVAAYNALFDKLMPVAIAPPFNRVQLAYMYGRQLFEVKKYRQAYDMLEKVPANNPNRPAADTYEMLTITQWLGDPTAGAPTGEQRKSLAQKGVALAESVRKSAEEEAKTATTPADKTAAATRQAVARQTAADLSRTELKDPAASLKALDGIEAITTALPADQRKEIEQSASRMRINNYLDLGKVDDAVTTLQKLMKVDQASGQRLMGAVLQNVGQDLNKAIAESDKPRIAKLSKAQADLSGYIVDWAEKSSDPETKKQLPGFRLFAAQNKQEAAELMDDAGQRKTNLEEALKQYLSILSTDPDNKLSQLGAGLVSFDLGNYEKAANYLTPLNNTKSFGDPIEEVPGDAGITKRVENTRFWEAKYKLAKSRLELYKARKSADDLAAARAIVVPLAVNYEKTLGGTRYHDAFVQLRTDLAAAK